jgi:hypothetical protein
MKTEISGIIKNFPASEIFLDDIESVYILIKDNFTKSDLIIDNNILENWEEISVFDKKKISQIKITGFTYTANEQSPHISLEVSPSQIRLYINNNQNLTLLGLYNKIGNILEQRKSPDFFKEHKNKFRILIFISVFIVGLLSSHLNDNIVFFSIFSVSFILGIFSIYAVFFAKEKQNQIHLTKQCIEPNFFEKNRDAIILVLLGAVVGAVLTFLFNFFILK